MEQHATGPRQGSVLPRQVRVLGWVSFFADVSGEMIYPLIPLFVVHVLGASATVLGGIEGAAMLIVSIVTAWAGIRSDRVGRRVPFVRVGYGLPVVGKALIAAATVWPVVLVGRLIDRLGKGLRGSPRDALLAHAAGPEHRGRAFGYHRAMDTAGAVVGVGVSALLVWIVQAGGHGAPGHAYRIAFGVAAVLGLVSVLLTFMVDEPDDAPAGSVERDTGPVRVRDLPARYWRVLALLMVFALGNSSDAFLLLRARDVGLSPWAVVLAYGLFNIVYAVGSYPAGRLSDRLGRWRIVGAGWAIYALAYAGFALAGQWAVWPLFALYGCAMALTDGVGRALISDTVPRSLLGSAMGIFGLAQGCTTLLASLVAGVLWDRHSPQAALAFGACMATAAVVLMLVLRPGFRPAFPDG